MMLCKNDADLLVYYAKLQGNLLHAFGIWKEGTGDSTLKSHLNSIVTTGRTVYDSFCLCLKMADLDAPIFDENIPGYKDIYKVLSSDKTDKEKIIYLFEKGTNGIAEIREEAESVVNSDIRKGIFSFSGYLNGVVSLLDLHLKDYELSDLRRRA